MGVAVDELEVGDDHKAVRDGVLLVEERLAIEDVDVDVVDGDADGFQGGLFGEEGVDVRGEEGVGLEEGVSEGALDRGLELLLGGCAETGGWLVMFGGEGGEGRIAYSFLNMLEDVLEVKNYVAYLFVCT